jgi:hypothetical protein
MPTMPEDVGTYTLTPSIIGVFILLGLALLVGVSLSFRGAIHG